MPGGARPGAGRKKGVPNKLARIAVEAAKATGILPHEFLLQIMRGEIPEVLLAYDKFGSPIFGPVPFEMKLQAAIAAAPYYAPKLHTVHQQIESTVSYVINGEPLNEAEFIAKYDLDMDSPGETEAPIGLPVS